MVEVWGKPKRKKGKDLFWGLPDGPKSKYPYNQYRDEYAGTGGDLEQTKAQTFAAIKKETDEATKDRVSWMDKIKGKKGKSEEE